jgi:toxin ParE1/3/4
VKRSVEWSDGAISDLEAQIDYIAVDNPNAAQRVVDQIQKSGNRLADMITGRRGRVVGTYEKLVTRLPYIIAFAIRNEGEREVITILRVIHTSRDWPEGEWPVSH